MMRGQLKKISTVNQNRHIWAYSDVPAISLLNRPCPKQSHYRTNSLDSVDTVFCKTLEPQLIQIYISVRIMGRL